MPRELPYGGAIRSALNIKLYLGPSTLAREAVAVMDAGPWMAQPLPGDCEQFAGALAGLLPSMPATRLAALARDAQAHPHGRALLLSALVALLQNEHGGEITASGVADAGAQLLAYAGYRHGDVARMAFAVAVAWIDAAIQRPATAAASEDLASRVARFESLCRTRHPGDVTQLMLQAARRRNVPGGELIPGSNFYQFGQGVRSSRFNWTGGDADSFISVAIAHNKVYSTALLARLGLPHTRQAAVRSRDEVPGAADRIGFPCVLKPADGSQGRGVSAGIATLAEAMAAFDRARRHSGGPVLVEREVAGSDYRLLVLGHRLVAAARRDPPQVTGDGRSTLKALVEAVNAHRRRADVRAQGFHPVPMDEEMLVWIGKQGIGLDDVVPTGRSVRLRGSANNHVGATPVDVLAQVHPDTREMAEMIARTLKLRALGIDFISTDISRPWRDVPCAVIELNQTPGFDVHVASGMAPEPLVELLIGPPLASGAIGRIPAVVVLDERDSAGSAIVARELCARSALRGVGLALADEVSVGSAPLDLGSRPPHAKAKALLANGACEALVLCCTPDDIRRAGFPVDQCDLVSIRRGLALEPELRALAERCSRNCLEFDPENAGDLAALAQAFAAACGASARQPLS